MLGSSDLVGFVATTDLGRARRFYGDVLGLEHVDESPVAQVFSSNGTTLRVTLVDHATTAPYTVLGWSVIDIEKTMRSLETNGSALSASRGWTRTTSASGPLREEIEWPGSRIPMANSFHSHNFDEVRRSQPHLIGVTPPGTRSRPGPATSTGAGKDPRYSGFPCASCNHLNRPQGADPCLPRPVVTQAVFASRRNDFGRSSRDSDLRPHQKHDQ